MQTLTHLYGVSKLYAELYSVNEYSKEQVAKSHEYVISQFKNNGTGGNWSYGFTVLDKNLYQARIELNGWSILNIGSFHQFNPKELFFDIQDPKGVTNKDAKISQKTKEGTQHYISFSGLDVDTINAGLYFFLQLSKYSSWNEYLQSNINTTYSNDLLDRIHSLEATKKDLEAKMEQIRTLING